MTLFETAEKSPLVIATTCPTCGQPLPGSEPEPAERSKRRRSAVDGPIARSSDPETSHAAAASVENVRERQRVVLEILVALGPSTDEQIAVAYASRDGLPEQSPSGLRTRRCELVDLGLVRWRGDKRRKTSGRWANVWEVIG